MTTSGPRRRRALLGALAAAAAAIVAMAAIVAAAGCSRSGSAVTTLRYTHMNPRNSAAGMQADFFAARVRELTEGRVRVEVYPDSLLGSIAEQLELVRSGEVDIHHTTAAAVGSLCPDFAVLDTPYLFDDPAALMRVSAPDSPLMALLGDALEAETGLGVLYSFYFGARNLSCDRPVRAPSDLEGVAVRAIPFPLYELAIEVLGGVPTPIDWALTPTALAAGLVHGQENPVDTVLTAKLYESQRYLMLTRHILGAEIVVYNAESLRRLSRADRRLVEAAAREAGEYGTRLVMEREEETLEELRERGMVVIGPGEGLELEAFRQRAKNLVKLVLAPGWERYYALMDELSGAPPP